LILLYCFYSHNVLGVGHRGVSQTRHTKKLKTFIVSLARIELSIYSIKKIEVLQHLVRY